jgi:hypothetical protein
LRGGRNASEREKKENPEDEAGHGEG